MFTVGAQALGTKWCCVQTHGIQSKNMFTFNKPSTCLLLRNFALEIESTQNVFTQGPSAQLSALYSGGGLQCRRIFSISCTRERSLSPYSGVGTWKKASLKKTFSSLFFLNFLSWVHYCDGLSFAKTYILQYNIWILYIHFISSPSMGILTLSPTELLIQLGAGHLWVWNIPGPWMAQKI